MLTLPCTPCPPAADMVVLSAIVRCYNEYACLNELYERLSAARINTARRNFEIVLITDDTPDEDASTSNTRGESASSNAL